MKNIKPLTVLKKALDGINLKSFNWVNVTKMGNFKIKNPVDAYVSLMQSIKSRNHLEFRAGLIKKRQRFASHSIVETKVISASANFRKAYLLDSKGNTHVRVKNFIRNLNATLNIELDVTMGLDDILSLVRSLQSRLNAKAYKAKAKTAPKTVKAKKTVSVDMRKVRKNTIPNFKLPELRVIAKKRDVKLPFGVSTVKAVKAIQATY